jgi:transcriptional regulator with PAS, ATPase and Fis domain
MRSASMRRLDRILKTIAPKDVTVSLVGESGAGKEVLARRIHGLSRRASGPFVPINCAAIPESLFESELFGHERGAFTGAHQRAKGKVEAAEGGTLFLDEVGEMPLAMQAKLLRFLESRRYMRVGGTAKIVADVRLLFATLRPLEHEVRAARFRADLFYRIQGIPIHVPALRERQADIPPLIDEFVARFSAMHGTRPPRFSRAARRAMLVYVWPGNVRELRNVVEMVCLLRAGVSVRMQDLPEDVRLPEDRGHASKASIVIPLGESLERSVERVIEATLASEKGNRTLAAERLGISVRTIQRHLGRHRA